jgi:hypothetical protein
LDGSGGGQVWRRGRNRKPHRRITATTTSKAWTWCSNST